MTRRTNLPNIQYQYVAIAPWFSPTCTQSYLAATREISAFVFYIPSQNTTAFLPPPNDETWSLGDGGHWKSKHKYPVYAVPSADGAMIMQQLAQYSGKMSEVKNGNVLIQKYDPTDYVRLYSVFSTSADTNLPTLWAFLLIVLGIVLLLVGIISLAMHYIQRRNRRNLRRRVENGEVDIRTLGTKLPSLTQADIDALPLILYLPNKEKPPLPIPPTTRDAPVPVTTKPQASTSPQDYSQPTCPICLEDYIPHETSVRSLPCKHIFHPACIDQHLPSNPLCPICKQNITTGTFSTPLPCPPITNAMVRRERQVRRIRERTEHRQPVRRWTNIYRHLTPPTGGAFVRSRGARGRRGQVTTANQMEMGTVSPPPAQVGVSAATTTTTAAAAGVGESAERPRPPPQDLERRREWVRWRASALLGRGGGEGDIATVVVDAEEEERIRRAGMSRCEFPPPFCDFYSLTL